MPTILTPEQFKQRYGEVGLTRFRPQQTQHEQSRFQETVEDIKQTGQNIASRFKTGFETAKEISQSDTGFLSKQLQIAGAGAKVLTQSIGDLFTGVVKGALSQEHEKVVKEKVANVAYSVLQNPVVSPVVKQYVKAYQESSLKTQRNLEGIFNIAMLGLDVAGLGATKKAVQIGARVGREAIGTGAERVARFSGQLTQKTREVLPSVSGIKQTGVELVERVPRFVGKIREGAEVASVKATRIKEGTPLVRKAIKSNLDEKIINTVSGADKPTLKAYKEIVNIAENSSKKIGLKQRPEIIAGKVAEEQFNLIEKQRKNIGKQIGETVSKLSKTTSVNMTDSYKILNDVLNLNGIKVLPKGKLKFTGRFTPKERSSIQELYSLAIEGGDNLTPRQIFDADRLFGKLQRETRLEGIGELFVETGEGDMSLFRVFRDVFANKLDNTAPQIKGLNREYRNLVTLVDDVEKSIVKGGNFEVVKGVGGAEFAQVNLRRILSNAQSAGAFREIAKQMDDLARKLGFSGAKPEDLIAFAEEIKKIFPEAIAPTSLAGQTRLGIKDIVGKVLETGKPKLIDQQRALIELINSLVK